MKIKSCNFCLLALIAILSLTSCTFGSHLSTQEQEFLKLFPETPLHGYFRFTIIDTGYYENGIPINVDNISGEDIRIDITQDHKIYVFREDTADWALVPELVNPIRISPDPEKNYLTLSPESEFQMTKKVFFYSFTTKPDLVTTNKSVTVRIVVIGDVIKSNKSTGKKVGGYFDIDIK